MNCETHISVFIFLGVQIALYLTFSNCSKSVFTDDLAKLPVIHIETKLSSSLILAVAF